jgi:hypothetical protein
MTFVSSRAGLISAAALVLVGACSSSAGPSGSVSGKAGSGAPGSAGSTGSPGTAGSTPSGTGGATTSGAGGDGASAGTNGSAGGNGMAGSGAGTAGVTGSGGSSSAAGSSGAAGSGGAKGTVGSGGTTGTAGSGGATGSAGASGTSDPPPPRPINVMPGGVFQTTFNGQPMSVNKTKPILGKLVMVLGGIGGGPGGGGIESFFKQYGFHVFAPKTQTGLTGGSVPAMYKNMLTDNDPTNDAEANRQVGDARTDLWDGKGRVTWNTVGPGTSILEETLAAIKNGMTADPGGDWGFFLNADGTLRTTDVWVVGYSWGSQSWAMISSYIRFGRVICTSGPVNEGFPNGSWMTHPSATPNDRKYVLVGQAAPWPTEMEAIFANVIKAGWPGMVVNVLPNGTPASYTPDQHLFAMIGGNGGITPGGHTVFCNDNPANGWIPLCKYVFGQQ